MEFINDNTIRLQRAVSDLDRFVIEFVEILQTHTPYVLISGYVAILFGRTRTTEDVDYLQQLFEIQEQVIQKYKEYLSHRGKI